jgi:hypothetical protein
MNAYTLIDAFVKLIYPNPEVFASDAMAPHRESALALAKRLADMCVWWWPPALRAGCQRAPCTSSPAQQTLC